MLKHVYVLFLFPVLWVFPSYANDTLSTLGLGGLEFKQTPDIRMEEEQLFISKDLITVGYKFKNNTNKDITERVAFPLPELTAEGYDDSDAIYNIQPNTKNPINFKLTVNGKSKPFETERKYNKTDNTYKVTYHWLQTFPANSILEVHHSYKPVSGEWIGADKEAAKENLCIEDETYTWLATQTKQGYKVKAHLISYILTTGANWQDSIRQFTLTVKKSHSDGRAIFCGSNIKKIDSTTFVMQKSNFKPNRDLLILFLDKPTK